MSMPRPAETMQCYLVGGAVRDRLLALPVVDRDWVVVGSDMQAMLDRGFHLVDASFPVFLHPQTKEEYALARRERKSGAGYRGFEVEFGPDVTLVEDLSRRDLTINAMARDDAGEIIDPFSGRQDLAGRLLRHVSPAFVEDPLRVLRVARFAARLAPFGFRVAHETHRLMREMAEHGDLDALTAERVWRETVRAMEAPQPWRYFEVLHRCGALAVLLPELAEAMGRVRAHDPQGDSDPITALKRISGVCPEAAPRLAATLMGTLADAEAARRTMRELRADRASSRMVARAVDARDACIAAAGGDADAVADLALAWHAIKPAETIDGLTEVCAAQHADTGLAQRIRIAVDACQRVSGKALQATGLSGSELGSALDAARRQAVREALAI